MDGEMLWPRPVSHGLPEYPRPLVVPRQQGPVYPPGRVAGQLADLHLALLLNGVYTTPRGMINLSTALSPADLDDIGAAYETAFTMVRRGLSLN